jgi:serine phosphatase RsbU (regulator of sigma subunit)/PAS domain-containing protein
MLTGLALGCNVANNLEVESVVREYPRFHERVDGLRAALNDSHADHHDVLAATLLELEHAREELRVCQEELAAAELARQVDLEREDLRRILRELATPVLVLDQRGKIRFANRAAVAALPVAPGGLSGRLFVTFIEVSSRAVFRTQFAAVRRAPTTASFEARLMRAGSVVATRLSLTGLAEVAGSGSRFVVQLDTVESGPPPVLRSVSAEPLPRADLMAEIARLLIGDEFVSAPGLSAQVARLLAAGLGAWAVVDLARPDGLCRVAVHGTDDDAGRAGVAWLAGQHAHRMRLSRQVQRTGTAVLQPQLEDETSLGEAADGAPMAIRLHAGSVLIVPIGTEGVLTLIRQAGRSWFDALDRSTAEEIGAQLAIALRSARRRARTLAVSRTLQRSLLPPVLPAIPGIEVAATYAAALDGMDVGGDFFDVFQSRSGWGFVLGDVCGRGEEAAALTALVRHGTRVLSHTCDRPEDVLRQINEAMIGAVGGERFVTVIAGQLGWAGASVRVRLANSGHPPAAVLRADGSVEYAPGGGLPLGAFPTVDPPPAELSLAEGDTMLLYTDGVTEARSPAGDFYTDARLTEALHRAAGLSAAGLVTSIERDVDAFTHDRRRDDLALLALRVIRDPALQATG